jgi:excisionase family DNA binding protein
VTSSLDGEGPSALPRRPFSADTQVVHKDPEAVLSVTEVAERLRRTPGQVLDLIEQGELRFAPTTNRRTILVPESALIEFLAHHGEPGRSDGDGDGDG